MSCRGPDPLETRIEIEKRLLGSTLAGARRSSQPGDSASNVAKYSGEDFLLSW